MTVHLPPHERAFLERAVRLGRRGWGRVHPNPMVGCVLVKDGVVVGEGWHQEYGGPHAEVYALADAGEAARGSSAFVSLEPCHHFGQTPPCSAALKDAGVARVVFAAQDPGMASGGGGKGLIQWGVEVLGPVFNPSDARRENPSFFQNQEDGSTYVAVKLAQTLDGMVAEGDGRRTPITGSEARFETHRLRAGFDAVAVGSQTLLVDDPLLTVREAVPFRTQPARLVLDSVARTPPDARIFEDVARAPVIIFTGPDAPSSSLALLEKQGAQVVAVPSGPGGLSLEAVIGESWNLGIKSVFCEGGGVLASSLMGGGFARRLFLFVAPFVLGLRGVPAFPNMASREGWEPWHPAGPPEFFGRDVLLTYDRTD